MLVDMEGAKQHRTPLSTLGDAYPPPSPWGGHGVSHQPGVHRGPASARGDGGPRGAPLTPSNCSRSPRL